MMMSSLLMKPPGNVLNLQATEPSAGASFNMADRPPPLLSGSMPSSFDGNHDFYNERPMQKIARKLKEEPLVPLGVCLTVFAFVNAYRALRKGDSQQANKMFRARVAAQGFTVVAMVAGSMYYSKDREKTKELQKLREQRDAEEKRLKWIRELEVRDDEDKALKARLEQKRQKPQPGPSPEPAPEGTARSGTGGILGKMGLWPREEDATQEGPTKAAEETSPKKQNPKSSLGAIGEVIASNKKGGGDDPTPTAEVKPEKKEP